MIIGWAIVFCVIMAFLLYMMTAAMLVYMRFMHLDSETAKVKTHGAVVTFMVATWITTIVFIVALLAG